MEFQKACLIMLSATFVWASPLPQHQGVEFDEVYQAYSPGQYANEGHAELKTVPRLVASKNGHFLRAVPASALKRVRLAGPQAYAVEAPVTYSQQLRATPLAQQQQPVYYVQRAPQPQRQQQPLRQVYKAAQPIQQKPASSEEAEDYPGDPNPQYNFSFDVKDDDLTNYQNRQEQRDEAGVTKGSYSVIDPDGYVRTVVYTADSKNGFQAKVTREPTDVKIKFPVPTESPEQQQQQPYQHRTKVPSLRTQQFAQYPETVQRYNNPVAYSQQQQQPQQLYSAGPGQPTYVLRRVPSASARVVKVLRQQ